MSITILATILISFFAFGAALMQLRGLKDWRYGVFAGMTAFMSAAMVSYLFAKTYVSFSWDFSLGGSSDDIVGAIMCALAMLAVSFMERSTAERKENERLRTLLEGHKVEL